MSAKLIPTAEQQQILSQESAGYFVDAAGAPTHVVLPLLDAKRMFDEYLRRELNLAFEQIDGGEVAPLDAVTLLKTARARKNAR